MHIQRLIDRSKVIIRIMYGLRMIGERIVKHWLCFRICRTRNEIRNLWTRI